MVNPVLLRTLRNKEEQDMFTVQEFSRFVRVTSNIGEFNFNVPPGSYKVILERYAYLSDTLSFETIDISFSFGGNQVYICPNTNTGYQKLGLMFDGNLDINGKQQYYIDERLSNTSWTNCELLLLFKLVKVG